MLPSPERDALAAMVAEYSVTDIIEALSRISFDLERENGRRGFTLNAAAHGRDGLLLREFAASLEN